MRGLRSRAAERGGAGGGRLQLTVAPPPPLSSSTGSVAEFAHPHELLERQPKSRFAMLIEEQGEATAAGLRAKAKESWLKAEAKRAAPATA